MMENECEILIESGNEFEAKLIEEYLKSHGIDIVMKPDEGLFYAGGMLKSSTYQIWVQKSQFNKAKKLLEEKK